MIQQEIYTRQGKQAKQGWDWISEEEYKKALCILHTYVFEADFVKNTFYSAKDNWEEMFGQIPKNYEELYEKLCERCHPEDRENVRLTFSKEELNRVWNRGEQKCSLECRIQIQGTYKWFYCAVILYGDVRGHLKGVIGCGRDRNTRKEEEAIIRHQATHDELTDIWNWRAGSEILEDYMELEMTSQAAFVLIRIVQFKKINDEYGYAIGNQILKEAVALIESVMPEESCLIRYSGGEFILFMEIDNTEQIRQLLERIQSKILESLNIQTINGNMQIKIAMGVSLYPKHGKTTERLLECANYALHTVKSDNRRNYALYDRMMEVEKEKKIVVTKEDLVKWEEAEDIVYMSNPVTHEIYYVNRVGRECFGIEQGNYQNRKCYEVFQGRPTPCPFCKKGQLKEGDSILWKHKNEKLNREFLIRDRLFRRDGRLLHVEIAIDMSKKEN